MVHYTRLELLLIVALAAILAGCALYWAVDWISRKIIAHHDRDLLPPPERRCVNLNDQRSDSDGLTREERRFYRDRNW